jgi:hydrogenase maturation protein HypF
MLPGGDAATAEPWRIALSLLHEAAPDRLGEYTARLLNGAIQREALSGLAAWMPDSADPRHRAPEPRDVDLVRRMLHSETSLVPSTALGRLFDGVAALLGVTLRTTYEGQAPMELEVLARDADPHCDAELPPDGEAEVIDWVPLVRAIVGAEPGAASWPRTFHQWVARAFFERAASAVAGDPDPRMLLASGGCLQNSLLRRLLTDLCTAGGLQLRTHRDLPPGDGGLSLGVLRCAQARLSGRRDTP